VIELTRENINSKLSDIYPDNKLKFFPKQRIPDFVFNIILSSRGMISPLSGNTVITHFSFDGVEYPISEITTIPFLMQAIVNRLCSFYSNKQVNEISKYDYILGCTMEAEKIKVFENERAKHFSSLSAIRKEFLEFIKSKTIKNDKGKLMLSHDAYLGLDEKFVKRAFGTIANLKKSDFFISRKVYQFGSTMKADEENSSLKRKVYVELRDCFTNITTERCYPQRKRNCTLRNRRKN
jgi:hypothetical protein